MSFVLFIFCGIQASFFDEFVSLFFSHWPDLADTPVAWLAVNIVRLLPTSPLPEGIISWKGIRSTAQAYSEDSIEML